MTELIYDITEIEERLTDYGVYKREKGYECLDGYAEFCKLYAAQEGSKESGDDLACLKFAFSHMSKMQTVRCLDWGKIVQLLRDEDELKPFASWHRRDNVWVDHETMRARWFRCWHTSKGPMIWDRMDPYLLGSKGPAGIMKFRISAQLETVLRAAYESKATISNFSVQNFTRLMGFRYGPLVDTETWHKTPARLKASPWLFDNLRHFSVGLTSIQKPEEPVVARVLGELLSRATHLETFELESTPMHCYHIHEILGPHRWPRIRSIRLVGMILRPEPLQAFLRRNAATLKEVDIGLVSVPYDHDRGGQTADFMAQHLNLDGVMLSIQFIPRDQLLTRFNAMEWNAMVRTMEARVLHGRSNSLRPL